MKAIKLEEYKINGRAIAEAMWSSGGTNASRTNRKGAYYYSCAAHGGYVVSGSCLTKEEKALLHEYTSPQHIQVLVQHRTDGDYVIGVSLSNVQRYVTKNRNFRYAPHLGKVEWQNIDIYIFEEDCDWSILEKLTDIRASGMTCSKEERQKFIDNAFNYIKKHRTPEGEKPNLIKV